MITERGVTRPGVFLDKPEKPAFTDVKERVKNTPAVVEEWAEKKKPALLPIPSGVDQWGKPTARMGLADPKALARFESTLQPMTTVKTHDDVPEPGKGTKWERPGTVMKGPSPTPSTPVLDTTWLNDANPFAVADVPSLNDTQDLVAHAAAPVMKSLNVINDGNTRVNNARKWMADDPYSDKDKQIFEYTTPKGNQFKTPDIKSYYRLGGGKIIEAQFMKPTGVNSFMVVDEDYKGAWEPVRGKDGQYRVPVDIILGDGSVVPIEDFQAAEKSHTGFDDGTILAYADGTVPENMRDPHVRQVDGNRGPKIPGLAPGGINWGPADPRAPWQDTAGVNMWEDDYDPSQKATNESAAWLADLALGSAPYMVPIPGVGPAYAIASGVARGLPAFYGFDPDTYMPEGRGTENLGRIGEGVFEDKQLTNAQSVGKTLSPIIDQWAERASGDIVGGGAEFIAKKFPAFAASKAGKFMVENPAGRFVSSLLTEGAEEAVVSPFDQLGQDSLAGLGVEKVWNEETNKYDYRADQSVSDRVKNVGKGMAEDALSGAVMGGAMSGAKEVSGAMKNIGKGKKPRDRWQEPAAAPRMSQHELELLMKEER